MLFVKNYIFLNRIQCHLSLVIIAILYLHYAFNNNLVENTKMFFHDYLNLWIFF